MTEITRGVGPLCPVLMEAMQHQSDRIEEFYSEHLFIIESTTFGLFTLTIQRGEQFVKIQELFPTIESVLTRIKFCHETGIDGQVRYEK